jgi:hypothetical protein
MLFHGIRKNINIEAEIRDDRPQDITTIPLKLRLAARGMTFGLNSNQVP